MPGGAAKLELVLARQLRPEAVSSVGCSCVTLRRWTAGTAVGIHDPDGAETIGGNVHTTLDAEIVCATVEDFFVGSSFGMSDPRGGVNTQEC